MLNKKNEVLESFYLSWCQRQTSSINSVSIGFGTILFDMVSKGKSKRDSLSFSFGITFFSKVFQKRKNHLKIICFYIIVIIANLYIV